MARALNIPRVKEKIRRDIVGRFARTLGGRPQFCLPTIDETWGLKPRKTSEGNDGKVIYPSREAAEEAARFLVPLGSRPMRAYRCERSKRGHWHLATDRGRSSWPSSR